MAAAPQARDPRLLTLGSEVKAARTKLQMSQAALAHAIGTGQTHISKDENGQEIPDSRLKKYCDYFKWDYALIKAFLAAPAEEPVIITARREYNELLALLDGQLRDAEEQDLAAEALQLVIAHRYPDVNLEALSPDRG